MSNIKTLIAIPVYNEEKYVEPVISKISHVASRYKTDLLVIDDGSTDNTPLQLAKQPIDVIRHATNRGYGQAMIDAFRWADFNGYDWVITMDCDEQHEPESLPDYFQAIHEDDVDIISGSRYLRQSDDGSIRLPDDLPPSDRRQINLRTNAMISKDLGLNLTDSFCGFKAYRVSAIRKLSLDVKGYAFPLQFWVQSAIHNLRVKEIPIRLIYNDPTRSFGTNLDNPDDRWQHYVGIYQRELNRVAWRETYKYADIEQPLSMNGNLRVTAGSSSTSLTRMK